MAPQILGGEEYSIKCDVWSLGVMFYQMLYGILPWNENNSILDLYNKIKKDKVQFPNTCEVDAKLKSLITNMLQVEEEKRYSVIDVATKLDEIEL